MAHLIPNILDRKANFAIAFSISQISMIVKKDLRYKMYVENIHREVVNLQLPITIW